MPSVTSCANGLLINRLTRYDFVLNFREKGAKILKRSISKEVNCSEHEYMNMSSPMIELATQLSHKNFVTRAENLH